MPDIMNAHPLTFFIVLFAMFITPFYWTLILPTSRAIVIGWLTAVIATLACVFTLLSLQAQLGMFGGLLIGGMWLLFPGLVWINRRWFAGLSQKPIVGLQIFRLIGAVFLVEMERGHIPASFAGPAGVGDILVGLFALYVFLRYAEPPRWALITLIVIGIADFISAFFFGFTSSATPLQLFATGFDNQLNLFPTGLIPLFLVPYAICFHIISLINLPAKASR